MMIEIRYNIGIKQNMEFGSAKGKMPIGCSIGICDAGRKNRLYAKSV